jgi:hypothetical protein
MTYRNQHIENWSIHVICKGCKNLSKIEEKDLFLVLNYFPMPSSIQSKCNNCQNLIVDRFAVEPCVIPKTIRNNLYENYKRKHRWWKFWNYRI